MAEQNDISINQWLDKLLAKGVYGFAKEALQQQMPGYSVIAVKRALSRLSTKGKIISIHKGYYNPKAAYELVKTTLIAKI
jgi:hypothetical protein